MSHPQCFLNRQSLWAWTVQVGVEQMQPHQAGISQGVVARHPVRLAACAEVVQRRDQGPSSHAGKVGSRLHSEHQPPAMGHLRTLVDRLGRDPQAAHVRPHRPGERVAGRHLAQSAVQHNMGWRAWRALKECAGV